LLTTSVDYQREDLYKPKIINGIKQEIKQEQLSTNFLQKFGNTSLDFLVVIGGSWYTHTRIEAGLTLIPPEQVAEGALPFQTNRPSFPFNTSLSIKKDLHDFIVSFDVQNQYVPNTNKNNFSFAVNLELTAFPFSTKDLTNKAQSGLGSVTNSVNNAGNLIR
ncbi:MAG: hypothetical protein H7263_08050, partial [Candidatus Sericytochromatia bacterium]|nr:hypothetical protein [Candidatus Sericytochromatia bacterium]